MLRSNRFDLIDYIRNIDLIGIMENSDSYSGNKEVTEAIKTRDRNILDKVFEIYLRFYQNFHDINLTDLFSLLLEYRIEDHQTAVDIAILLDRIRRINNDLYNSGGLRHHVPLPQDSVLPYILKQPENNFNAVLADWCLCFFQPMVVKQNSSLFSKISYREPDFSGWKDWENKGVIYSNICGFISSNQCQKLATYIILFLLHPNYDSNQLKTTLQKISVTFSSDDIEKMYKRIISVLTHYDRDDRLKSFFEIQPKKLDISINKYLFDIHSNLSCFQNVYQWLINKNKNFDLDVEKIKVLLKHAAETGKLNLAILLTPKAIENNLSDTIKQALSTAIEKGQIIFLDEYVSFIKTEKIFTDEELLALINQLQLDIIKYELKNGIFYHSLQNFISFKQRINLITFEDSQSLITQSPEPPLVLQVFFFYKQNIKLNELLSVIEHCDARLKFRESLPVLLKKYDFADATEQELFQFLQFLANNYQWQNLENHLPDTDKFFTLLLTGFEKNINLFDGNNNRVLLVSLMRYILNHYNKNSSMQIQDPRSFVIFIEFLLTKYYSKDVHTRKLYKLYEKKFFSFFMANYLSLFLKHADQSILEQHLKNIGEWALGDSILAICKILRSESEEKLKFINIAFNRLPNKEYLYLLSRLIRDNCFPLNLFQQITFPKDLSSLSLLHNQLKKLDKADDYIQAVVRKIHDQLVSKCQVIIDFLNSDNSQLPDDVDNTLLFLLNLTKDDKDFERFFNLGFQLTLRLINSTKIRFNIENLIVNVKNPHNKAILFYIFSKNKSRQEKVDLYKQLYQPPLQNLNFITADNEYSESEIHALIDLCTTVLYAYRTAMIIMMSPEIGDILVSQIQTVSNIENIISFYYLFNDDLLMCRYIFKLEKIIEVSNRLVELICNYWKENVVKQDYQQLKHVLIFLLNNKCSPFSEQALALTKQFADTQFILEEILSNLHQDNTITRELLLYCFAVNPKTSEIVAANENLKFICLEIWNDYSQIEADIQKRDEIVNATERNRIDQEHYMAENLKLTGEREELILKLGRSYEDISANLEERKAHLIKIGSNLEKIKQEISIKEARNENKELVNLKDKEEKLVYEQATLSMNIRLAEINKRLAILQPNIDRLMNANAEASNELLVLQEKINSLADLSLPFGYLNFVFRKNWSGLSRSLGHSLNQSVLDNLQQDFSRMIKVNRAYNDSNIQQELSKMLILSKLLEELIKCQHYPLILESHRYHFDQDRWTHLCNTAVAVLDCYINNPNLKIDENERKIIIMLVNLTFAGFINTFSHSKITQSGQFFDPEWAIQEKNIKKTNSWLNVLILITRGILAYNYLSKIPENMKNEVIMELINNMKLYYLSGNEMVSSSDEKRKFHSYAFDLITFFFGNVPLLDDTYHATAIESVTNKYNKLKRKADKELKQLTDQSESTTNDAGAEETSSNPVNASNIASITNVPSSNDELRNRRVSFFAKANVAPQNPTDKVPPQNRTDDGTPDNSLRKQ